MNRKKSIAIATQFDDTRIFYDQLLRSILGERFHIGAYNFSIFSGPEIHPDVLLITTPFIINYARPYVHHDTKIIRIQRTFTKEALRKLATIDVNDDILLVNNGIDVTFESIELIYSLGFTFKLHPCYPGLETPKHIRYAITLEEEKLVPTHVERVYNLGRMVFAVSTLNELLEYLEVDEDERGEILHDYKRRVIPHEPGLHSLIDNSVLTRREMEAVLDLIGEGVISIDNDGMITTVNSKASEILALHKQFLLGKNIDSLFPDGGHDFRRELHAVFTVYGDQQLILDSRPTIIFGECIGTIVTLKKVTELRRLEERVRKDIALKGHVARYCLKDILGSSSPILSAKKQAEHMAQSDSSVIITGESGTGKELFAQAIHLESARSQFPFVAINCAALPENLIESELFGYEGGAFTGASSTGKPGLFEDAHLGTLFLDEIGDISPNLQVRLLRVLQEGEVIRVGSTDIRKVDVRIIAATNRDLRQLTEQGAFRWDLYYRLNVLPLSLPPLRERLEDIESLFYHFLMLHGCSKAVSPRLLDALKRYHWPGNIRQLDNVTEYLSHMGSDHLVPEDLPPDIKSGSVSSVLPSFDVHQHGMDHLSKEILDILAARVEHRQRTGRKMIVQLLEYRGVIASEREVRARLKTMEELGLVAIGKGKQGTVITTAGIRSLDSSS